MRFAGREAGLVEAGLVGLEAKKVRSPDSAAGFSLFVSKFVMERFSSLWYQLLFWETLTKTQACIFNCCSLRPASKALKTGFAYCMGNPQTDTNAQLGGSIG